MAWDRLAKMSQPEAMQKLMEELKAKKEQRQWTPEPGWEKLPVKEAPVMPQIDWENEDLPEDTKNLLRKLKRIREEEHREKTKTGEWMDA